MNSTVFAFDIDGTVLHSRRLQSEYDVCVEYIDSRQQGFMKSEMFYALRQACAVARFVPITSRSMEQFKRINWDGFYPDCAYVANGAIVIYRNGKIRRLDRNQQKPAEGTFNSIVFAVENDWRVHYAKVVDDCYVVAYLSDDEVDISDMSQYCGGSFTVFRERKKVYFFPIGTNKGIAIDDIRNQMGNVFVVCAGDSSNDIPMLKKANLAIAPASIANSLLDKDSIPWLSICPEGYPFEEFLYRQILELENFLY